MKEKLQKIRENAIAEIEKSDSLAKLNEVRTAILGKKGELTAVLKGMKDVAPEERPKVGQLVNETRGAIEEKLSYEVEKLGRKEYMLPSLSHSAAFSFYDDESVLKMVNSYAPEHLIINTSDPYALLEGVESAGSVFLGPYSPESAGDYASGTNHTLPTSGHAASQSGVSVDSFIKKITVQELTKEGIRSLAPTVITMAEAEELTAHAEAARVRMA